jgi:flagellum-specific peptidoglycan hydrolase FlgJ
MNTKEFIKGQWVVVPALWRKYPSWQASMEDHAAFLRRNPRYKACFLCATASAFAKALLQAGYATDPEYANKLIALMDRHQLQALDGGGP